MKKQEFINALAEKLGITKKYAREVYEGFFEVMEDGLLANQKIPLGNIGRLEVRTRSDRLGYNIGTGKPVVFKGRKYVSFKESTNYIKELIN